MQPNSALRLAYLVSQFPTANHAYLLREIEGLRKLGIEVEVASVRRPEQAPAQLGPEGMAEIPRTYYVKSAGVREVAGAHAAALLKHPLGYLKGLCCPLWMGRGDWRKTLQVLFYFIEAVLVGRWMERNGLSHVHVHFSSTVGLIARYVFPITVSFTFHGPAEFYDISGFHLAEKVRIAKFVCAISRYGRSQLLRVAAHDDWQKIEWAPLGVDPSRFLPRPSREAPAPCELLCVGRLENDKAQHVLIAALERLVRERRNVRLRLAGDGPERASLERDVAARGLAGHVVFEGWLDQERLRAAYHAADIFVLPSFAEGLPVVLMEAMAVEIPCITTQITGIPELIRHGADGILVSASDDAALADAIACLMDDPALRVQLGTAGRRRVMREYNLEQNVLRLADIFSRRLTGRPFGASEDLPPAGTLASAARAGQE